MAENDEHRIIMETAADVYMKSVSQVVLNIAGNLSKHYLEEPVKQAIGRKENVWAGQIVFSRDELIDVRLNEKVQGHVREGNLQYQVSRTMYARVRAG